MLRGGIPDTVCSTPYGASLVGLRKKDGGIRPIAVGDTLRRLAAKIVSRRVMKAIGEMLSPTQVGYGSSGGTEAAIPGVRAVIEYGYDEPFVQFKLDCANALNSIYRANMLEQLQQYLPDISDSSGKCTDGRHI